MRLVTLEILNQQDWEVLKKFLTKLSIKIVEKPTIKVEQRNVKLKNALLFWENKVVDFTNFKFGREEANER